MKYRYAQLVRRSIRASVAWKIKLVMYAAKKGTKLKIVQGGIKHKELENWHQHQSNNLQLEEGKINHGKAEILPLY